jgi:hypothetical protein
LSFHSAYGPSHSKNSRSGVYSTALGFLRLQHCTHRRPRQTGYSLISQRVVSPYVLQHAHTTRRPTNDERQATAVSQSGMQCPKWLVLGPAHSAPFPRTTQAPQQPQHLHQTSKFTHQHLTMSKGQMRMATLHHSWIRQFPARPRRERLAIGRLRDLSACIAMSM